MPAFFPLLVTSLLWTGVDLTKADAWQSVGDGVWSIMKDGTIVGERDLAKPANNTDPDQAWFYTKDEFGEYDLHVEWWTRLHGNSGISIHDTSRARYAGGTEADPKKTPSHIGYEIQIWNGHRGKYPSGSVYLFAAAKSGIQIDNDWNAFDIEVRDAKIRVKLNGQLVAEAECPKDRPKRGPIGLQLHDGRSIAMFRNIRLTEIK